MILVILGDSFCEEISYISEIKCCHPKSYFGGWGANADTIRTTALALSYSMAESAAPVWVRSPRAKELDTEQNSACRAFTGCLKPTNVEDLFLLAGIVPLDIRRDVCATMEKIK